MNSCSVKEHVFLFIAEHAVAKPYRVTVDGEADQSFLALMLPASAPPQPREPDASPSGCAFASTDNVFIYSSDQNLHMFVVHELMLPASVPPQPCEPDASPQRVRVCYEQNVNIGL